MMTRKVLFFPVALCLGLALPACQVDEIDETPVDEVADEPADTPQVAERAAPRVPGQILDEAVEFARSDLAKRESVAADRIELVEARAVTWRDGSRGCPRPDSSYSQALVNGVYIRLSIDGDDFHYHGAADGRARFCPPDRRQEPIEQGDRSLM